MSLGQDLFRKRSILENKAENLVSTRARSLHYLLFEIICELTISEVSDSRHSKAFPDVELSGVPVGVGSPLLYHLPSRRRVKVNKRKLDCKPIALILISEYGS